jgi:hypothetical protein
MTEATGTAGPTGADHGDRAAGDEALGLQVPRGTALAAVFLVSLAGLLLEVAYTRVISYKLWYYYTYLVIGLALLGLGTGATAIVLSRRLRAASTVALLRWGSLAGAASVVVGYAVVARMPIDTIALWDYGSAASRNGLLALAAICLALFSTFIAIGVIISALLGRGGAEVGRLYFADLLGAGLGCLVVVLLVSRMGPTRVIMLAAALLAGLGAAMSWRSAPALRLGSLALCAVMVVVTVCGEAVLPTLRPEAAKVPAGGEEAHGWGPVFRVDVGPAPNFDDRKFLIHDGTWGSGIFRFDGDPESLTRFDADPRSWPFALLGEPPEHQLIIGSAGGNEILASLYHDSEDIQAVELNPVTVDLLEGRYREYSGNLLGFPEVSLTQGDGRSYLARSDDRYDLVWFVAPDSYAANNAASSGAFVLSESYLYTTEMITETLEHLSDDGISVAQFGEVDFAARPNRTARYVVTARAALEEIGVEDPSRHIIVATSTDPLSSALSTIAVKRTPFTAEEVQRFVEAIPSVPSSTLVYAPGVEGTGGPVADLAGAADEAEVEDLVAAYPAAIHAITDDAPFFWHFTPFDEVAADMANSATTPDREIAIGERVLLLLLAVAAVFAVTFLLLPFVVIRRQWVAMPAKGPSAVFFAAIGLGFMLYEITMIQRLVGYLGYPSYSLTVTLASILVFTGLGALWSNRFAAAPRRALPALLFALVALTALYRFGLGPLTEATLEAPFTVRVLIAFAVLAPLGLCLGMFMPFGLRTVGALSAHPDEYVAWGWAINGVFSVIGSVLTTILSMSWGFRTVQVIALGAYVVAVAALWRLDLTASGPAAAGRSGAGRSPEDRPVGRRRRTPAAASTARAIPAAPG